jgi:hypothetical protein
MERYGTQNILSTNECPLRITNRRIAIIRRAECTALRVYPLD